MRVLVVEDDQSIGSALLASLRQDGFAVTWVQDGLAACSEILGGVFEVVLLDLGLPLMAGQDVLHYLRTNLQAQAHAAHVIISSAVEDSEQKVTLLDDGADDYVVKPFSLDEISARVRAVARRVAPLAAQVLTFRGLNLHVGTREVRVGTAVLGLSARDADLLEALLQRPGKVVSKLQLVRAVYGGEANATTNAIEQQVFRLRQKLEQFQVTIKTIRGLGYCLQ
jgi:DNA-binding response OmpR family regulator